MGKGIKQGGGGGGAANGIKVTAKGLDNIKPNMFATFDGTWTSLGTATSILPANTHTTGLHLWENLFFYYCNSYAVTARLNADDSFTKIQQITAGAGGIRNSVPIRLDNNRVFVVSNSSGSLRGVTVTVNNDGTMTAVNASLSFATASSAVVNISKIDESHVLCITYESSTTYARVLTISNTGTISVGTALAVSSPSMAIGAITIIKHSNGNFYCAAQAYVYGLKVNGTSVSFLGSVNSYKNGYGYASNIGETDDGNLFVASGSSILVIPINEDGTITVLSDDIKAYKSNLALANYTEQVTGNVRLFTENVWLYGAYVSSSTYALRIAYIGETPHGLYSGPSFATANGIDVIPYENKVICTYAQYLVVAYPGGTVTNYGMNKNCITKTSFREGSEGKVLI